MMSTERVEIVPAREDILKRLRGQKFQLNGLQAIFGKWMYLQNKHIDPLREDVNNWLLQHFPGHTRINKLIDCNFASFGASWFPHATYPRLKAATLVAVWLFLWDDAIDHGGEDGLALSYDDAQTFRQETLESVRKYLALGSSHIVKPDHTVIKSFRDIGQILCSLANEKQRRRFLTAINEFVTGQEEEQKLRLKGGIPTPDEFWNYRIEASAVSVALAMNEICNQSDLPDEVLNDKDLQTINLRTKVNFCAVNDLISLRKEIASGSIESIIPVRLATEPTPIAVQTLVDSVKDGFIKQYVDDIDVLMTKLLHRYETRLGNRGLCELWRYIEACKALLTTNLFWSLKSPRYGLTLKNGNLDQIDVQL